MTELGRRLFKEAARVKEVTGLGSEEIRTDRRKTEDSYVPAKERSFRTPAMLSLTLDFETS